VLRSAPSEANNYPSSTNFQFCKTTAHRSHHKSPSLEWFSKFSWGKDLLKKLIVAQLISCQFRPDTKFQYRIIPRRHIVCELNYYCYVTTMFYYYTSCITATCFGLFRPSSGIYNFVTFTFYLCSANAPYIGQCLQKEDHPIFNILILILII
jgi:hypothetical protein